MTTFSDDVHGWVRDYYGNVLSESADLKTNACCATAPPNWLREDLSMIHDEVQRQFYGCGFPVPQALEGAQTLDLGCGTGRDVFLLSRRVGPTGHVHGVDMTPSQLEVAREFTGWHMDRFGHKTPNVTFHQGYIEDLGSLGIEPGSLDVIVSNCVVNLSPRKDLVLAEAYRLLKPGGEFYFSDVFVDRRLARDIAFDPILHSECLGGAMYEGDFVTLAKHTGFLDPREMTRAAITIQNAEIERKVGAARFVSVTWRLFKLPELEVRCEDYGQLATYKGSVPEAGTLFWLDDHHAFEAGRPERVCGNTASMLQETRLAEHFTIVGDTSVHFGEYPCGPTLAAAQYAETSGEAGVSCC